MAVEPAATPAPFSRASMIAAALPMSTPRDCPNALSCSGVACGLAKDVGSAFAAMKGGGAHPSRTMAPFVPTITFHGDRDTTVNEANSAGIVAAATAASSAPLTIRSETGEQGPGRSYTRLVSSDRTGRPMIEQWTVHGSGHAWSGGQATGSYTDPRGPDASREMLRFFLSHRLA